MATFPFMAQTGKLIGTIRGWCRDPSIVVIVVGSKENPGVVTEGAKVLGVSRQALSNLVNCHARISADMAVRLAKAFGSTTETWIRLQAADAVEQAQAREGEIDVEHYEPQPVAVGSLAIVDDRDDGIPT